jgi:hypothetical protein
VPDARRVLRSILVMGVLPFHCSRSTAYKKMACTKKARDTAGL